MTAGGALLGVWLATASADPLALEDVWSSVSATHPLLDAARTRAAAAAEERVAAAGALDPTVAARAGSQLGQYDTAYLGVKSPLGTLWGAELSAGWQLGTGTFDPYEGALKTEDEGEWVVGFDVALLRDAWTDRKRATLAAARHGIPAADAELRQRELELLRAAGHRWVDWQAAGHRWRVASRLLEVAEARDRAYETQQALGELSPFVREDARRMVLERRERLVTARRAFDQAAIELSTWLRDPDARPLLAGDELLPDAFEPPPPPSDPDPRATAEARRPELARLRAQLEQLAVERRLQSNQALPAVDVVGKTSVPLDPKGKDEVELGVVAEWTALSRTARARREVASLGETRLRAELAFAGDRVGADVDDALNAVAAAGRRVDVARELVSVARAVEQGERRRFELGDSNLVFVNQREIAAAEAEAALVDAIAAMHRAAVDLRWATGTLEPR